MKINYIGCGTGDLSRLTFEAVWCLNESEVIVGPQRLLDTVRELSFKEKRCIVSKTYGEEALSLIKELEKEDKALTVSVLFSGDSSFFSGAKVLFELLYENNIKADYRMVPGISSLQYFASKLVINWAELEIVSTHGVLKEDLEKKLCGRKDIFLLTGGIDDAITACDRIICAGFTGDVTIGIDLSYPDEVIASDTVLNIRRRLLEIKESYILKDEYRKSEDQKTDSIEPCILSYADQASGKQNNIVSDKTTMPDVFESIGSISSYIYNSLIVMIIHCSRFIPFNNYKGVGIPDRLFKRGTLPLTKRNIRTLIASKLQVCSEDTVLDIGAGTGGVSIELSMLAGKVIAIEKEEVGLLSENKRLFGAWNLDIIKGEAPEILSSKWLYGVKADKVFIGGSGGRIREIIQYIHERYPEAVICFTAILLETLLQGMSALEALGYHTEVEQISVSRSKLVGGKHMMMAENPVYIVLAATEAKRDQFIIETED